VAQYDPWSLGHAVAWSAEGSYLAVSAGEAVHLYDRETLQEQEQIDLGAWGVGLAFNPADESMLAVAGRDGALQVWNVQEARRLAYQPAHARGANSLAFSPDGLYLASTGNDAMVRLWLVSALLSGEQVQEQAVMIGGAVAVPAIRYSPDGALVASIDLQVVRLRDPLTQRLVRTLYGKNSMFTLAFSPDGQWLAAGEMGSQVRVWNVADGNEVLLLYADATGADPARAFVWSLDFSPDGTRLAAGSSAGTLTVWSLPGGELVQAIRAHSKAVSGLAFDPLQPRLFTCGLDAAVRTWPVP
jgi:WD40 repeat protein